MAIQLNKTPITGYKYIPVSQREEKEPFTVWVKPISSYALVQLEDNVVSRENERVMLSSGMFSFRVLQKSLVSWENITDSEGDAMKIKRNSDGTCTEETISYIGSEIITEVSNIVAAISRNPANVQIFFPAEEPEVVVDTPKKVKASKATPTEAEPEVI